jgi:drug/metabolite transporter (DMT)-like permease
LVFNALIWGVSWWPLRWLAQQGLHPLWATGFIFVMTTLVMVAWYPQAVMQLVRTPGLWVIALASGMTNTTFNWGVVTGDVVRVVLLFYLMPVWATLLARLLLNEAVTRFSVVRMGLGLAGAVVVLWPENGLSKLASFELADGLGLIGGFGFALNNVMLRHQAASAPQGRILAMFAGCAVLSTSLALCFSLGHGLPWPPAMQPDWMAGCALVALMFLVGNLALQMGASRLPAQVTAVVMLTEVMFASLSAIAWGGQVLKPSLLAGGGLIVLAAFLSSLDLRKTAPTSL